MITKGTFFQPFINGINTFFNPSQFRNPLNQFRNPPRQQSQQQFSTQQFPPQSQQRQPQQQQQQQQPQFTQQFNFQDFRNNPTFQQDFQITRFPEGTVTSEQQFSLVPRQQTQSSSPQFQQVQQSQSNRFNSGFPSPSVRPFTDNVPTVPAVTSFDRFRPSEASDSSFRFQPSQRPDESFSQESSNSAIFPPRLNVEQATFPNSHTVRVPPTFSLRPDVVTAPSVEPVSVSGIINRNPVSSTEGESTGTAFRGRKRVRPRFEPSETGGRNRVRNKVKISVLKEKDEEDEEENDTVPPTTASRGRLRSRFSASAPRSLGSDSKTRSRLPTGPRVIPTGKRRRQKFGKSHSSEDNDEDIENNNVPEEEDRRSGLSSPRRKLNRLSGHFTSRRKTTSAPDIPVTRIPPRRRLRPFSFGNDQDLDSSETESPQFLINQDENDEIQSEEDISTINDNGISVLPISTFG